MQAGVRLRSGEKPALPPTSTPASGNDTSRHQTALSPATTPVKGAPLLVCNGQDTDIFSAYGVHDAVGETTDQLFPHGAVHQRCGFRVFQDLRHGTFNLVQERLAEPWTARIVVAGRVIEFLLGHRMEGHP